MEGGRHFKENNLKINELSGKEGIPKRINQARPSEHLSVEQETCTACLPWTGNVEVDMKT